MMVASRHVGRRVRGRDQFENLLLEAQPGPIEAVRWRECVGPAVYRGMAKPWRRDQPKCGLLPGRQRFEIDSRSGNAPPIRRPRRRALLVLGRQ